MDRLQLRLRMLVTVGVLVVLNVAFVTVIVWLFGTFLFELLEWVDATFGPGEYSGTLVRLVLPWELIGLLAIGFMAWQLRAGYRRTLERPGIGESTLDDTADLEARVARLAKAADVPVPSVSVVPADAPNCYTVGRAGDATLVISQPALEALDDRELDAVLAHEIAHVGNRDVTIMTVGSLLSSVAQTLVVLAIVNRGYVFTVKKKLFGGGRSGGNNRGRAYLAMMLLAAAVFLSVLVLVCRLFRWANLLVNRILSRYRELAADREAARLLGDPGALASALETLDDAAGSIPETDLRTEDNGVQTLCILPFGTQSAANRQTAADDPLEESYLLPPVGDSLLPCSHPDTEDRIDALARLEPVE